MKGSVQDLGWRSSKYTKSSAFSLRFDLTAAATLVETLLILPITTKVCPTLPDLKIVNSVECVKCGTAEAWQMSSPSTLSVNGWKRGTIERTLFSLRESQVASMACREQS